MCILGIVGSVNEVLVSQRVSVGGRMGWVRWGSWITALLVGVTGVISCKPRVGSLEGWKEGGGTRELG